MHYTVRFIWVNKYMSCTFRIAASFSIMQGQIVKNGKPKRERDLSIESAGVLSEPLHSEFIF